MALSTVSSSSFMVSITTRGAGCRPVMNRVASMPSSSGIWMSMITTSGLGLGDDVDGVLAVGGGADDLEAVERPEQRDQAVAHDLVVVDDDDADGVLGGRGHERIPFGVVGEREPGADHGPAGGRAGDLAAAAELGGALPERDQADAGLRPPGRCRCRRR